MYRPPAHVSSLPPHSPSSSTSDHLRALSFATTSKDAILATPDGDEEGVQVIAGSFLGCSENGFVSAPGSGKDAWKCTIEGGSGTLHWA
jgi:hypothetical protein